MSDAPSLAPGARGGPYQVVALLGEGGMGQVYRARDERLSREVALKVVHADLAQDAERLRRFEHEAKAAGTLNHPNIAASRPLGLPPRARSEAAARAPAGETIVYSAGCARSPIEGRGGVRFGLPRIGRPVSPDGRRVVALGSDGLPALHPLAGGEPVALPGPGETDLAMCWTPDGRELWVARYEDTPPRIERVEVASGRARPWNRLGLSAPRGQYRVLVTPDGGSYAYSFGRRESDLYLTSPLK